MADNAVSEAIGRADEQCAEMGGAPDPVEMDEAKVAEFIAGEQERTAQAIVRLVARLIQAARDNKAHGAGRHLAAGCRHCESVAQGRAFIAAMSGPSDPTPPGEQLVEFEERTAA